MSKPMRPIIVVTGANGGVGFGICQRLLFQLCEVNPTDALPQSFALDNDTSDLDLPSGYDGLTLIMACRSTKRAEAARTKLLGLLDSHVAKLRKRKDYDGHADEFQKNVVIDIMSLDLAMISSVFRFADEVSAKYPYISRLICNAGVASFSRISWPGCIKQMLTAPMISVTAPNYYGQHSGERSIDGLGWVWQCNLFGHYVLFRSIQHLLLAAPPSLGARVIWTSSIEASPVYLDADDWQLRRTDHSYESVKYQIDLVSTTLDRRALQSPASRRIRHFVTQPGVCSTNVSAALVGPVMDFFKVVMFYIARFLGSPHHPIMPYKAAIGAVHLTLASLTFITLYTKSSSTNMEDRMRAPRPAKFGAETDWYGTERVGVDEVKDWEEFKGEGEMLLGKCEALFQTFKDAEEVTVNWDTASEHM